METRCVIKVLIVNQNGDVLIIRRSKTDTRRPLQWDFPGGWLEDGEEITKAVIREAKEEAGIRITSPRLIFGTSDVGHGASWTFLLLVARVDGVPPVTLSYEHDSYQWVRPAVLLDYITYERQRQMVRYVLDNHLLETL